MSLDYAKTKAGASLIWHLNANERHPVPEHLGETRINYHPIKDLLLSAIAGM